jgi:ABC-type transport system involved in multi-copper enzyme maturation permease subunit
LSPASEIALVFRRELRRNLRSTKGIALGVLTMMGAFVTALASDGLVDALSSTQVQRDGVTMAADPLVMKKMVLEGLMGGDSAAADALAGAPLSLVLFLRVSVWLAPMLVALLGFDCVAGELQTRTVRYWAPRTRRSSYIAGKLLGLWATVSLATLALYAMAGAVGLQRGAFGAADFARYGLEFWAVGVLIAGAWVAVATLLSSAMRSPAGSLLTTFAAFFALWIAGAVGRIAGLKHTLGGESASATRWLEYLYPNAYDTLLLSHQAPKLLGAAGGLLGFVVLAIVAGSAMFEARDI